MSGFDLEPPGPAKVVRALRARGGFEA